MIPADGQVDAEDVVRLFEAALAAGPDVWEIVARLHKETLRTLQMPKMQERLAVLGVEPMEMTTSEFEAYVVSATLLERIGLKTN